MFTNCPSRTLPRTGIYGLQNQLWSPFHKLEQCVPSTVFWHPSLAPWSLKNCQQSSHIWILLIAQPGCVQAGRHKLIQSQAFFLLQSSSWYLYDQHTTPQKLEREAGVLSWKRTSPGCKSRFCHSLAVWSWALLSNYFSFSLHIYKMGIIIAVIIIIWLSECSED